MDNLGLPITYKLFKGNTNDCSILMPVLNDLKNNYGLGRIIIIVVANKGMNTGENITYNILHKNGYIYSQTVHGANADLKEYVLSNKDYEESSDGFKIKSRIVTNLSKKEHIEAHFLTCFVSLLLLRLIQINTNEKYSTKTLVNEMKNITGTYVDKNYYMFDYCNEIVEDLGKTVGIDFSKRFMTLGEIKNIISQTKN